MTPRSDSAAAHPEKRTGSPEPVDGRCGAKLRGSDPPRYCLLYPAPGSARCSRFHGGNAPQVKAAAVRTMAVEKIREHLGVPLEVDPHEAILAAVHEAAGNVAYLRPLMVDPTNTIAMIDVQGKPHTNPVLAFYNDERDRLARYSKMAIDAGIDERRVRIAESHTERLGAALDRACVSAGLDDAARSALMSALAAELRKDAA